MDLKEFTKQTLLQIVEGANEANDAIIEMGAFVPHTNIAGKHCFVYEERNHRHVIDVDFDVAITTTETEDVNGGMSLKIASLVNVGAVGDNKLENQTISRIKYSLPLVLAKK